MKRRTLAVAAFLVVACLAATGGKATEKRELRVGFVTYAGVEPSKRTFEGQMLDGFLRADRKLDVQGRVAYIAPNQDAATALQSFARQKYDLVIAAFPGPLGAIDNSAKKFPHVRFFMPDIPIEALPHRPKNVRGSVHRAEEAGYLAGYLAALIEGRRPGKHAISAVGGIRFIGVTRWIVGYQAGAKKADPSITVLTGYSRDFTNPAKCRRVALSQIAKGSGVVLNVAGTCGLGALRAAKDEGVWGVGVDIDQSYLGPHILTSAILRLDNVVFNTTRSLVRGRFSTGGNSVFDLHNGGVGLGKISPKVPRPFLRRLETIRKAIASGRIQVPRAS
jgi:basic membrane protein A and related proteins